VAKIDENNVSRDIVLKNLIVSLDLTYVLVLFKAVAVTLTRCAVFGIITVIMRGCVTARVLCVSRG
jgi:hypothetical protein